MLELGSHGANGPVFGGNACRYLPRAGPGPGLQCLSFSLPLTVSNFYKVLPSFRKFCRVISAIAEKVLAYTAIGQAGHFGFFASRSIDPRRADARTANWRRATGVSGIAGYR